MTEALERAIRAGCKASFTAVNPDEEYPGCDFPDCNCSGIGTAKAIIAALDLDAIRQQARDRALDEAALRAFEVSHGPYGSIAADAIRGLKKQGADEA